MNDQHFKVLSLLIFAFVAGPIACSARSREAASERQPSFARSSNSPADRFVDLAGKSLDPLHPGATRSRGSVLIFIAPECPISNAYAPEITRLCNDYQAKGFAFYIIYSDPDLTESTAREHLAAYGYTCAAILDTKQQLARAVGATVTPEVALVDEAGEVPYRGRIDDLFEALGKRRFAASTHELRDALDAMLAGSTIARPRTEAIGCSIPGMTESERKS